MGSLNFCSSSPPSFQPIYHGDLSPCLWETITASLTLYYLLIITPLLFFYFRSLSTSSRPWTCRYQYTFYLSALMIVLNLVRFIGKFWYARDIEIFEYYCGIANILSWILATTVLYKRLQKGLQGAHGIILPPETRPIYTLKTWITSHQPLTIFWISYTLFSFSNLRYTIRNNYFPSTDITEEELEFQQPLNFYSNILSCFLSLSILCLGILACREKTQKKRSKKKIKEEKKNNNEISDEYDEGDSNEEDDEEEGSSLQSGSGGTESYPAQSIEFHSRGSKEEQHHKKKHKSEGTGKKTEHYYYDKHAPKNNDGNDLEGKKKQRGSVDSGIKHYLLNSDGNKKKMRASFDTPPDDPRSSTTDKKRANNPNLTTSATSLSPPPKLTKSITPTYQQDGGTRGFRGSSGGVQEYTASTPLLKGNS